MERILQPTTDAGVALQAVLVLALVLAVAWRARHDRDLLRLTLGSGVFLGGLFVLRAMH